MPGGGEPNSLNENYYSDAALRAAGGNLPELYDGTLDFYTVHYYYDPNGFGADLSPFVHPVSDWGLSKPLAVTEFCECEYMTGVPPDQIYPTLYGSGYAGAMWWSFSDRMTCSQKCNPTLDSRTNQEVVDQDADFEAMLGSMIDVRDAHPYSVNYVTDATGTRPEWVPPTMVVEKTPTGEIRFIWSSSTCNGGQDFAVLEGNIGDWGSHAPLTCGVGIGTTAAIVDPGAGSHYYLVVPLSAESEGSYGRKSNGVERAPSEFPCRTEQAFACY